MGGERHFIIVIILVKPNISWMGVPEQSYYEICRRFFMHDRTQISTNLKMCTNQDWLTQKLAKDITTAFMYP